MNILFLWGAWITPASAQDASSYGHDLESVLIVGAIEQLDSPSTWQRHHAIQTLHTLLSLPGPVQAQALGSLEGVGGASYLRSLQRRTLRPRLRAELGLLIDRCEELLGWSEPKGLLQADEDWHPLSSEDGQWVWLERGDQEEGPIELTLSSCMPLDVTGFDRERRPLFSFGELDPERIMRQRLRLQPEVAWVRISAASACEFLDYQAETVPELRLLQGGTGPQDSHSLHPSTDGVVQLGAQSLWFTPELPEGELFRLRTRSFSAVMDPLLRLYALKDGSWELLMEDDDGSEGLDAQLIWSSASFPELRVELTQARAETSGAVVLELTSAGEAPEPLTLAPGWTSQQAQELEPGHRPVLLQHEEQQEEGWLSFEAEEGALIWIASDYPLDIPGLIPWHDLHPAPDWESVLAGSSWLVPYSGQHLIQLDYESNPLNNSLPVTMWIEEAGQLELEPKAVSPDSLTLEGERQLWLKQGSDEPLEIPLTASRRGLWQLDLGLGEEASLAAELLRIVDGEEEVLDRAVPGASFLHWDARKGEEVLLRIQPGESARRLVLVVSQHAPWSGLQIGDRVRIHEHSSLHGETDWLAMMDRYLGMEAIVTERLDDPYGGTWYVRLDADEGQYAWRARDLESLE